MSTNTEAQTPNLARVGIGPWTDMNVSRSELCTDKAAAMRFCDTFHPFARHVPEWGWVWWDGCRWKRDTEDKVVQMALEVGSQFRAQATALSQEGSHQLVKWILDFARKCESARGITDFLRLAKPALHAALKDFDRYPWRVNCRNCTLDFEDLAAGSEIPRHYSHRQGDCLTKVTPHDWVMGAPHPRWDAFLKDIFPSDELRGFIQRAAGYSLLGITREQCFFICHGTGANGKSTFLNALLRVFGPDYAQQADPRTFSANGPDNGARNDLADLRGARFVSAIETAEGKRLDEALVKQATGCDAIRARHLYHEAFQFDPEFKLWLASNHCPTIRGTDHAMWRRVILVPFTVAIPPERTDKDLEHKLLLEAEGILDWAVEGAVRYCLDGLQPPDEVLAATGQYRRDQDLVGQFLDECTRTDDPHAMIGAAALYDAFVKWAGPTLTNTAFGRGLRERGTDRVTIHGRRYYIGIRLLEGEGLERFAKSA